MAQSEIGGVQAGGRATVSIHGEEIQRTHYMLVVTAVGAVVIVVVAALFISLF